jgi:hypothetical protein
VTPHSHHRGSTAQGNYVSEWFGHRLFPTTAHADEALRDQQGERCPFLSAALQATTPCTKRSASRGVCTVTTKQAQGVYREWIVCPYRMLDSSVLEEVARRSFGMAPQVQVKLIAAQTLKEQRTRELVARMWGAGSSVVVFFQDKLGGEISIPGTAATPELSFDIVMVELHDTGQARPTLGRYALLEAQAMDFHGSYHRALQNLQGALRLHRGGFYSQVRKHPEWLSEKVEGPNIANVFKRTFYQVVLKFRLAGSPDCAGATLALPKAVWESWQPHLGKPELTPSDGNIFLMIAPIDAGRTNSSTWIYVLDFERPTKRSPIPLRVDRVIATTPSSLAYFAFESVPQQIMSAPESQISSAIRQRLARLWPEIQ